MSRKLNDLLFIAFDVETTGLNDLSGRVVEIAAVEFNLSRTVSREYSSLINPGVPIPEHVVAIHGISNRVIAGEREAGDVFREFLTFISEPGTIMLAHNASFDVGFVANDLSRCGLPVPHNRVVDTLSLAKDVFPGAASYSLEHLVTFLGIGSSVSHRARDDALMARELFSCCIERGNLTTDQDLLSRATVLSFKPSPGFTGRIPAGFEEISRAIEGGKRIGINYAGGTRGTGVRTITPLGLIEKNGILYLSALCHADGYEKSFRLDRIEKLWIE